MSELCGKIEARLPIFLKKSFNTFVAPARAHVAFVGKGFW